MSKLQGGCLCGGIRYEIDGPVGKILHCHCSMCRKAHGSAFRTRLAVPYAFRFLKGEDLLERYDGLPEFEEFPPADDIS